MKNLARASVILGMAAFMPAAPLLAQGTAPLLSVPSMVETRVQPTVESRLEYALELQINGRFKDALREFSVAAREQKKAGVSSAETLWQIAEIHYALGSRLRSAQTLDDVASEAAKYGDPEMQAKALFEAAVHYAAISRHAEARARMDRLEPLMVSPFIGDDFRSRVEVRSHV
jgi:hypothetical protein